MPARRKLIKALTTRLLAEAGITCAPVDVEQLAKSLGIQVRHTPADPSMSGFLLRNRETGRTVIGVNSNEHRLRQRFTVAHELGHYLLHQNESVHVDRREAGFQVKLRDGESATGTNLEEIEANLFAAELLMPAEFLRNDLVGHAQIDVFDEDPLVEELKTKYQVSIRALTIRLANLGYVTI